MRSIEDQTDEELHDQMQTLLHAVATRSSTDWEGDRQRLGAVTTELESRGYKIG
ncbi:hypothetical protein ACFORH_43190 [Amycolatopsis roodepoortensis]|uniref:Uncharacterized protein n=1 Tax=Amycolatopsis roodepoortensis TaxID=700274 RepID=A0ABR9LJR8_9PSEU|nr:hypothetical protein [Amycolatopsis roodepoortensis]MBE1580453.1 hypothetical protein [Amycolatopsis roodepoortensis]